MYYSLWKFSLVIIVTTDYPVFYFRSCFSGRKGIVLRFLLVCVIFSVGLIFGYIIRRSVREQNDVPFKCSYTNAYEVSNNTIYKYRNYCFTHLVRNYISDVFLFVGHFLSSNITESNHFHRDITTYIMYVYRYISLYAIMYIYSALMIFLLLAFHWNMLRTSVPIGILFFKIFY